MVQFTTKFKPSKHKKSFKTITNNFENLLQEFNPIKNSFEISDYFSEGNGLVSAINNLHRDGLINLKKDFQGIYIYLDGKIPFYTGISKGVINRTLQHTKGHNHQTSSLAYRLGQRNYETQIGEKWNRTRNEFDFKNYCGDTKRFLGQRRLAFMPIENPIELYLFEVYCAMELRCEMNSFETH